MCQTVRRGYYYRYPWLMRAEERWKQQKYGRVQLLWAYQCCQMCDCEGNQCSVPTGSVPSQTYQAQESVVQDPTGGPLAPDAITMRASADEMIISSHCRG